MEIKEFGKENPHKIVLIPGCMMCWKQFDALIPYLAKRYHVIAVSTDGFDGSSDTAFTTAENSAKKLAGFIKEKLDGNVQLVFGESFGSATAVMLFNDRSIRADSLIINGPQYMDLGPLTKLLAYIIPRNQYHMLGKMKNAGKNGNLPLLLKLFTRSGDGNMLDMFAKMPDNISFETLENCTKEALALYERIENFERDPKARVSVWYGAKEPNMKKAVQKIKTVYPNAEIHPFKGLGHGEILAHPEYMAKEIMKFIDKSGNVPVIINDHIKLDELRYCKPIKLWLKKRYGSQAKKIWRKTAARYNKYLTEIPDYGGKNNGHAQAIYGGLLVFAWYGSLPDKPPIEELQPFVNELFFGAFSKAGKVFDLNRPVCMRIIDMIFRKSGDRDRKDIIKYRDGFVNVDIPYDRDDQAARYKFTQCPNADFAKKHGLLNILPLLCNCDYYGISQLHGSLIRHGTCGNSDVCDYCVVGNRNPIAAKYETLTDKNGFIISREKVQNGE